MKPRKMNRVSFKSISLTYADLLHILQAHDIEIIKGAAVHLATYTPYLGEMSRHDAGYINPDGELVITVITDTQEADC